MTEHKKEPIRYDWDIRGMRLDDAGDYVDHSEYAKLQQQNAQLLDACKIILEQDEESRIQCLMNGIVLPIEATENMDKLRKIISDIEGE